VIEPVRKRGLATLLRTIKPLEEDFPEIDDPVPCLLRHGPPNG
jgi:antitoxin VapB